MQKFNSRSLQGLAQEIQVQLPDQF